MKDPVKILTVSEYERLKPKYNIYFGTEEPDNGLGSYGDLFVIYKEPEYIEPYNEALALVGLNRVSSLDDIMVNSDMCTALAGNSEASTIMKTNYSSEITTAINSNWSEGLNALSYKCGLSCTLLTIKHATDPGGLDTDICTWNHPWTNRSELGWSTTPSNLRYTTDSTYCNTLRSITSIDLTSYSTITFNISMENTDYLSDQLSVYPCVISSASGTPVASTTWDKAWGTHTRETRYTVTLDVANVIGEHMICLRLVGNSSSDILFTIWINECTLIAM